MYLAAIYSQLQQQANASTGQSSNATLSHTSEKPAVSSTSNSILSTSNSVSSTSKEHSSTTHRRKQTNPSSFNAVPESSRQTRDESYRMTSLTNDASGKVKREPTSNSQDAPLSLVRSKDEVKANSENIKSIKTSSNDLGSAARNSHSLSKENPVKSKQANEKSVPSTTKMSEKELLFTLQALAGMADKNDMNAALEEINKLFFVGSPNLSGGENADLNKINELLNATVAAEMKKLQSQQATLTREIENRSTNNGRNISPSTFRNQVSNLVVKGELGELQF